MSNVPKIFVGRLNSKTTAVTIGKLFENYGAVLALLFFYIIK